MIQGACMRRTGEGKKYTVHHLKSLPVFYVANTVEIAVPELYIATP